VVEDLNLKSDYLARLDIV